MNGDTWPMRLTGWVTAGCLLMALWAATVSALTLLERQRPASPQAAELSYLPKGEYLKVAVLGYRQAVADLIWVKAVHLLGGRQRAVEEYRAAYHAVDVLTDLDPKFVYAYQATGTILAIWGNLIPESVAILTKGVTHNPEVWELPFLLGYTYYFEQREPAKAAPYFRLASRLKGAPGYLSGLATRMTVEAGDLDAALEFLQRMYQQQQDPRLREGLEQRIREVVAEKDIGFLEGGVRQYRARYGRLPLRLEDLVTRGIIQQIPEEPLGGSYRLNSADGTVTSTGLRHRLRVYRH